MSKGRNVLFAVLLVACVSTVAAARSSGQAAQATGPGFLQAGSCYRIAFPIESPPNYKVLEVLDGGWIRAELDAGTAKALRASMWINTAQIITLTEVRCSG